MSQSSPAPETGKPLPFSAISAQLSFLKGEILTIADATFSDKEQRKAFKDLVRDRFTQRLNYLAGLCEDGSVPCSSGSVQSRSSTEELERAGPEAWLSEMAPHIFRGTLAPFHLAFWEWLWRLLRTLKAGFGIPEIPIELAYLLTLARGMGTNTTVEWAHIAVGALLDRSTAMLVSSSAKLATSHLRSIREEIEDSQVTKYYPDMANPAIGKFDNRWGWRGQMLVTNRNSILAAGLDGLYPEAELRRLSLAFITTHDIDQKADPLSVVETKERLIGEILNTQISNALIVMAGNLNRQESVISRTLFQKNNLLPDRRESGLVRAFKPGLKVEMGGSHYKVTQGTPVWNRFDMAAFQKFLDTSGPIETYAEYQGGDISKD